MKFIDSINIYISSGKGGDGLFSYSKNQIPNGGNGGMGGNIYFVGNKYLNSFANLKFYYKYKAENGLNGKSNNKTGKSGKNLIIYVPRGTIVYDNERNIYICEILEHKEKFLILKGGLPGIGNSTLNKLNIKNKKLKFGNIGEILFLRLELNLIADIGLLGLPNVGKSSFINNVSNILSKVGIYSFTTISPVLAFLNFYSNNVSISDMPGLLKNAYKGKGLGFKFLKHLSKTKLLLHILDLSINHHKNNPLKHIFIINKELNLFVMNTTFKRKWLILNKCDLVLYINFKQLFFIVYKRFNYQFVFLNSSYSKIGLKKITFNLKQFFYVRQGNV